MLAQRHTCQKKKGSRRPAPGATDLSLIIVGEWLLSLNPCIFRERLCLRNKQTNKQQLAFNGNVKRKSHLVL